MSEAIRYFNNAKQILSKAKIEGDRYEDVKYVQEACGTAYLAVLKTIDGYLIKRGIEQKDLPQSVDDYRNMLKKYLSIKNGKLSKDFEMLYEELHIAGYYRGNLKSVNTIKGALKTARAFIDKIKLH